MTNLAYAPALAPVSIPVRELLPWAIFTGLLALVALYFVGVEEGALSIFRGMYTITVETDTYGPGIVGLVNAMASIVALASGVVLGKYLMRPFVGHLNGTSSRRNRRR